MYYINRYRSIESLPCTELEDKLFESYNYALSLRRFNDPSAIHTPEIFLSMHQGLKFGWVCYYTTAFY